MYLGILIDMYVISVRYINSELKINKYILINICIKHNRYNNL